MLHTEVHPHIHHFEFDIQGRMCSTLIRFQEFYEHPKYRNRLVSKGKIEKYFKSKGINYNKYILGMNIPSDVFLYFTLQKKEPLLKKEIEFLELLLQYEDHANPFYVIATYKNKYPITHIKNALHHEIAHGLFHTDKEYREKALNYVRCNPLYNHLLRKVEEMGIYHKSVFEDEIHAYVTTDKFNKLCKRFGIKCSGPLKELQDLLVENFNSKVSNEWKLDNVS